MVLWSEAATARKPRKHVTLQTRRGRLRARPAPPHLPVAPCASRPAAADLGAISPRARPEYLRPAFHGRALLTGHTMNVFGVVFLDGDRMGTCAMDGRVQLHQLAPDLRTMDVYTCHRERVKALDAYPEATVFLSASEDGTCRRFDTRAPHACRASRCANTLLSTYEERALCCAARWQALVCPRADPASR
jgi:hypothetical protein